MFTLTFETYEITNYVDVGNGVKVLELIAYEEIGTGPDGMPVRAHSCRLHLALTPPTQKLIRDVLDGKKPSGLIVPDLALPHLKG